MSIEELRKEVGKNIKYYRSKKGMTQKELGEKLGVKNNTVSAYERGTTALGQDTIYRISNILDVNVDDLFPQNEHNARELGRVFKLTDNLNMEEMKVINDLISEALSMDETERAKFLDRLDFTIKYHKHMSD